MDLVLNRSGGLPLRDQIVSQIELKILAGEFPQGRRLPSVRALARRLRIHPRTVYAAYRSLKAAGQLEIARGSGVFVRRGAPAAKGDAHDLELMLRSALWMAFRQGFSGAEIRRALQHWLQASPPDRILVVDPAEETAELLAKELEAHFAVSVTVGTLRAVTRKPGLLSRALVVTLPFHVDHLRRLDPGVALVVVRLELSSHNRHLIAKLPTGSVALVVSHSPRVLPYARAYLQSLRGHDVVIECHLLSSDAAWTRVIGAADLVFADVLSAAAVRASRPRGVQEFRLLDATTLGEIHDALAFAVPRIPQRRVASP